MESVVRSYDIGLLLDLELTPESIAERVNGIASDDLEAMKSNCMRFINSDNWSKYEKRLLALYAGFE